MLEEHSDNSAGVAVAERPHRQQGSRQARQAATEPSSSSETIRSVGRPGGWDRVKNFRVEFGPSRKDILNFTNQLAVMIRAGISPQESLESIAGQVTNQKFKVVITDLKNRIEAGQSFSQALAEHPEIFNNLYINMVAAAEVSGSLSSMLQKLAEYLDSETETRAQVKGAMVYPVIIAVMAVGGKVFLLCFVLPRFTAIFSAALQRYSRSPVTPLSAYSTVGVAPVPSVPGVGAA